MSTWQHLAISYSSERTSEGLVERVFKCVLVCCTDLPDVFSHILRFYIKTEFTAKEGAFFVSDLL